MRPERSEVDVDAEADALNRTEPTDLAGFDSFGNPAAPAPAASGSAA